MGDAAGSSDVSATCSNIPALEAPFGINWSGIVNWPTGDSELVFDEQWIPYLFGGGTQVGLILLPLVFAAFVFLHFLLRLIQTTSIRARRKWLRCHPLCSDQTNLPIYRSGPIAIFVASTNLVGIVSCVMMLTMTYFSSISPSVRSLSCDIHTILDQANDGLPVPAAGVTVTATSGTSTEAADDDGSGSGRLLTDVTGTSELSEWVGFRQIDSNLADVLTALQGAHAELTTLYTNSMPAITSTTSTIAMLQTTADTFRDNLLWQEHKCMLCEESANLYDDLRELITNGIEGGTVAFFDTVNEYLLVPFDTLITDITAVNEVTALLQSQLEAIKTDAFMEFADSSVDKINLANFTFCGLSIFVFICTLFIFSWFVTRPSMAETLGGVLRQRKNDISKLVNIHTHPETGAYANENKFDHADDERTGHGFLTATTLVCWMFTYLLCVCGFALTSFNLYATQVSAEVCNLRVLTDPVQGPVLQQALWPEADEKFQQAVSICLSGGGDLRPFLEVEKNMAYAREIQTRPVDPISDELIAPVDGTYLDELTSRADVATGLNGTEFVKADTKNLLPTKLQVSNAYRRYQADAPGLVPGMWIFLDYIKAATQETPYWTFAELLPDPQTYDACTLEQPCRPISANFPELYAVEQLYQSVSITEMFRVSKLKGAVWTEKFNDTDDLFWEWVKETMETKQAEYQQYVLDFATYDADLARFDELLTSPINQGLAVEEGTNCGWLAPNFTHTLEVNACGEGSFLHIFALGAVLTAITSLTLCCVACLHSKVWLDSKFRSDEHELLDLVAQRERRAATDCIVTNEPQIGNFITTHDQLDAF